MYFCIHHFDTKILTMSNHTRLEQLIKMNRENPDDDFILYALAKEYEKLEMVEKAFESYFYLKEKNPSYVGVYYHLGKLLECNTRKHEAIEIYSEGIQMAKSIKDMHALSELQSAKLNLEIEMDGEV